jgi:hypothetical protein
VHVFVSSYGLAMVITIGDEPDEPGETLSDGRQDAAVRRRKVKDT